MLMLDAGRWVQDTGCKMLGATCWMLEVSAGRWNAGCSVFVGSFVFSSAVVIHLSVITVRDEQEKKKAKTELVVVGRSCGRKGGGEESCHAGRSV